VRRGALERALRATVPKNEIEALRATMESDPVGGGSG